MPINRLKQKVHAMRAQPEHVRLRAVTLLTAASGAVLIGLWLTVLLPLQLRLTQPSSNDNEPRPEQELLQRAAQNPPNLALPAVVSPAANPAQVAGTRDNVFAPTHPPLAPSPTPPPAQLPTGSEEPLSPVQVYP